ncbi:hypothetical protein ABZU45_41560 [Streptomyces avermitilis]|uniref:hypothetical protein n=1 Tax=Streptomyces avermitilis TaxID=33903 RepID=UPI0033B1B4A7
MMHDLYQPVRAALDTLGAPAREHTGLSPAQVLYGKRAVPLPAMRSCGSGRPAPMCATRDPATTCRQIHHTVRELAHGLRQADTAPAA